MYSMIDAHLRGVKVALEQLAEHSLHGGSLGDLAVVAGSLGQLEGL
jgi:hypothetical protein